MKKSSNNKMVEAGEGQGTDPGKPADRANAKRGCLQVREGGVTVIDTNNTKNNTEKEAEK